MNGPDHYREAERLAELAALPEGVEPVGWPHGLHDEDLIGLAQVHATLALAAATAALNPISFNPSGSFMEARLYEDREAWRAVLLAGDSAEDGDEL